MMARKVGAVGEEAMGDPAEAAPRALVVDHVWKRYGSRKSPWAVRDVSLRVAPGECVAIVGESGSGKTTIANMIVGVVEPTLGQIDTGDGLNVRRISRRRKGRRRLAQEVQMVFQDSFSSLDPSKSVSTSIAEPLQIANWSRGRIADRLHEVLGHVGLGGGEGSRRPRELSGGQRQRIGIARALGPGPRLLVLDEPVASLDVSIQGQILTLLRDIRDRDGIAMVLISHDLGVVRAIADRIEVMYRGSIVESGATADVLTAPAHPYTQGLVWAATAERRAAMPEEARVALAHEGGTAMGDPGGCVFRDRCWRRIEECDHHVASHDVDGRRFDCNVPLLQISSRPEVGI
jgi:peptide/nickel transport system ATP-binding protein